MRRALGTKPKRTRLKVRLEDRLKHDPRGGLHDPVAHRRDRQRSALVAAGLRDEDPTSGQRPIAAVSQVGGQFVEHPVNPVQLDVGDGDLIDAGGAAVAAHLPPCPLQDVAADDLVMKRMKPSPGISLGRPVERSLQFSDVI